MPKSPQKSSFLTRISPFVFPNLIKTLRWVGGFKDLGKFSQNSVFFLFFWGGAFPEGKRDNLLTDQNLGGFVFSRSQI